LSDIVLGRRTRMAIPIDRELYSGKYLDVSYSKEDEQIGFAFPRQIHKKEWEAFKKELEAVLKLKIK
jgi:hypothetical protein